MTPGRQPFSVWAGPFRLAPVLTLIALALFLFSPHAAPAAGTWSETGPLATARVGHTATRLADGRVLVVGGITGGPALASAELFDPATGTWAVPGPMSTPRCDHTATLLPDGRVLVAGGGGTGGPSAWDSAELFNPLTGTWSTTNPLDEGRQNHTATLLLDGRVLVAGGMYSMGTAEIFNPATDTWTSTGSLVTARGGHTATLLADGRVLITGGLPPGGFGDLLESTEIFDPAADTWSETDALIPARQYHTATLLTDGRVLVAGGYPGGSSALAVANLFNPATGTWSATGSLGTARHSHTATLLPDGRVLVAGGWGGGTPSAPYASVELYNPASGTWSDKGHLTIARGAHQSTVLIDGRILVVGGEADMSSRLASAEIYDPLNHVKNASLETAGVDPGGGSFFLPPDSTDIAQWTVGGLGVSYRGDWQAAEGRRCLELNGGLGAGSIRQVCATSRRTRYLVTFALAGDPAGEQGIKTMRVSAGSQSQEFTFDTTGRSTANMGWVTRSFVFTTGSTIPSFTTLTFESLTSGLYGPAIDRVRVIRYTPLPPLLPLLLD